MCSAKLHNGLTVAGDEIYFLGIVDFLQVTRLVYYCRLFLGKSPILHEASTKCKTSYKLRLDFGGQK